MLKLVVTASLTMPMALSTTAYMVVSARAIIVGPKMVPPGRSMLSANGRRRVAVPLPMSSALIPISFIPGISFAIRALNSSAVIFGIVAGFRFCGVAV